MEDESHGQGWSEYQRLVLAELQRHNESLLAVNDKLTDIQVELAQIPAMVVRLVQLESQVQSNTTDIAMLQVKAGLWGAGAGILAVVGAALAHFLS